MDNTESGRRNLHIYGFALQNYKIEHTGKEYPETPYLLQTIHWLSYSYHMGLTNLL